MLSYMTTDNHILPVLDAAAAAVVVEEEEEEEGCYGISFVPA